MVNGTIIRNCHFPRPLCDFLHERRTSNHYGRVNRGVVGLRVLKEIRQIGLLDLPVMGPVIGSSTEELLKKSSHRKYLPKWTGSLPCLKTVVKLFQRWQVSQYRHGKGYSRLREGSNPPPSTTLEGLNEEWTSETESGSPSRRWYRQ